MDRLHTPSDWWKFTRNGVVVVSVVAIPFCWLSSHSADEIAVVIGTPLIIFNCVPFLLSALFSITARFLPEPAEPLPPPPTTQPFNALPTRRRIIMLSMTIIIGGMFICFSAGGAILVASFAYSALDVSWAVLPARHLAFWLLAFSALPIVALVSFIIGIYYAGKMRSGVTLALISAQTRHPRTYWPTAA
jgi:hypothetical protein